MACRSPTPSSMARPSSKETLCWAQPCNSPRPRRPALASAPMASALAMSRNSGPQWAESIRSPTPSRPARPSSLPSSVTSTALFPYTIQTGTPILASVISYVNSTLSGVIQFVPQTNQTNYVTFNFDPSDLSGYCEASEGMAGGQQFIGGSINCSFTGTCHEMGHAIGLLHEHQRPDRNSYIVLTPANADKPYLLGDFDFFADDFQVIGLYDYASVMHYPAFSFTKNNLPVLESI